MPLALAGLALGAVGTGLSLAGNAKSQSAMNQARANEVAQQADLQNKNNALVQKSIAGSTPATAQQQMDAGAAARNNIWAGLQNATTPTASALPATGATTPTSSAAKRTTNAANTWNTLNQNAAAREGSYSDWQTQQAIKNADTAQQLGINNSFSQQDASLLPLEVQVAGQAGDKLSGWGSIVGALGSLAGIAGATGALGGAASAVTPLSQVARYPMANAMLNNAANQQSYNTLNPTAWTNIYRGE
ncbi:MAG: hypothetical protein KGL39_15595 [Patescibacteria group bacterium]|nr:hypothetical protein [Patescibacteria group bacterium]